MSTYASSLHFTGKQRDNETNLDYFGARYLGSNLGRFMTPDPLGGTVSDPQQLNRYAYARNNPINLTDPTGLYVVQCTAINKDQQKNCAAAANRFESQRQKDLQSKDEKTRASAKAWGERGEENHINVIFKTQEQINADAGENRPNMKVEALVGPGTSLIPGPNLDAEFSEDTQGLDLARVIAHEGDSCNYGFGLPELLESGNWTI